MGEGADVEYDTGGAGGGGDSAAASSSESTSSMWDRMAEFVNNLMGNGNESVDTPVGEIFGAKKGAGAAADTAEGKAAFAEQRRGEIGNEAYRPKETTGYYTSQVNDVAVPNAKAAAKADPEKPRMPSKSPDLLPIPKVDAGATGAVDPTVPASAPVTKSPSVFRVTPQQSKSLSALYGNNTAGMNDHILHKIASGDNSLGPYTPEQLVAYRQRGAVQSQGQRDPEQQRGTFASILGAAMKG